MEVFGCERQESCRTAGCSQLDSRIGNSDDLLLEALTGERTDKGAPRVR